MRWPASNSSLRVILSTAWACYGSGNIQVFMGLHRQPPLRMPLAPVDRQARVEVTRRAVHRLDQEIIEGQLRVFFEPLVGLRHHYFQFMAALHHQLGVGLGADTDPVDAVRY